MKDMKTIWMVMLFGLLSTGGAMGGSTKTELLFTCQSEGVNAEGALKFFVPLSRIRAEFKKVKGLDCSGPTNSIVSKQLPLVVKARVPVPFSSTTEPVVWTKFSILVTFDLCGGQRAHDFRYQVKGEYEGITVTGNYRVHLNSVAPITFNDDGNLANPASFHYNLQLLVGDGRMDEAEGIVSSNDCVLANY